MTDASGPLVPAIFIALTKHYALGYHGYDIDSPEFAESKATITAAIHAEVSSAEARGRREALEEVKALVKARMVPGGETSGWAWAIPVTDEFSALLSGVGEERSPR